MPGSLSFETRPGFVLVIMRRFSIISHIGIVVSTLAILLSSGCEKQQDIEIIRAISMLPRQTEYTRDFEKWIAELNRDAQGRFRVIFVGGPEAIPTFEQADALRTGVVHMMFGPATYYIGMVPEVEAMFSSNLAPMQTRANGGIALMDQIHREKLNARYLARTMYIEFHIFTRERPSINHLGVPDMNGESLRGGPVWRDFITSLNANFVNVAAPDVYMALERNMIQGVGWPIVGLADASWHQHLGYRIDPGVFSSDVGITFNDEKWQALPEDIRTSIESAAIEYEKESYHRFRRLTEGLDEDLQSLGMQVIKLSGESESRYRELANDVIWSRLRQRSPKHYRELRQKFFREPGE